MTQGTSAWLFQQVALLIGSVTVLLAALAVLGAAAGRAFDEHRSVIPPARWDQARQRSDDIRASIPASASQRSPSHRTHARQPEPGGRR